MADLYTPEYDSRLDKFRNFCKNLDVKDVVMEEVVKEPKPRYEEPEYKEEILYDIYKRATDLSVNRCVAIGFTAEEAREFMKNHLTLEVNHQTNVVTFYEKVEQGNIAAKSPLWNPKNFVINS